MFLSSDNIIAEITPAGRASVSGIRISGVHSKSITEAFFGHTIEKPRHAYFLKHQADEVVIIYYKSPNSYTGEDVCEIFCHGNPSIVNSLIDGMISSKEYRVRMAGPGEFTKRAYLNGKMDLVQAEAVADLINSSSMEAAVYRNQVLKGALSASLASIKKDLILISTHAELEIDFEEESAGMLNRHTALDKLGQAMSRINGLLSSFHSIEMLSKDIKVLILGEANVGKSSVFNALVERERSIVHEHPGTTRDYIEADIFMGGLEVTLIDTAGFRDTSDCEIEKMGISRVRELIDDSTLIIEITDKDAHVFRHRDAIMVRNKIDANEPSEKKSGVLYTSARDPNSIVQLRFEIEKRLRTAMATVDTRAERYLLTKRQKVLLEELAEKLACAMQAAREDCPIDAIAFLVRTAIAKLNEILGSEPLSDETLDELFSRFCIGK